MMRLGQLIEDNLKLLGEFIWDHWWHSQWVKRGAKVGKSHFFKKVASYHFRGTFINLIPHSIMKSVKSNQFSGKFVVQNLFLSC